MEETKIQAQKTGNELEVVRIRRIGVMSTAITFTLICFFAGIILGIIFALFFSLIASVLGDPSSQLANNPIAEFVFGMGIIISLIIPIVLAVFGFINGVIFAWLYNLSSKVSKGIKLFS